jgi:hypothetical protein
VDGINDVSTAIFMREVEDRLAVQPVEQRVAILHRILDLLRAQAVTLPKLQLDVFDAVIQRLAAEIETAARIELAEQLSAMENAPDGIVRQLAHDRVEVARSVLARCGRLASDDLVSVAVSRGQQHMSVIAERANLPSDVTDVLVERGDLEVVSKVVANPSARFSEEGFRSLLDRARDDDGVKRTLSLRETVGGADIQQFLDSEDFRDAERSRQHRGDLRERMATSMGRGLEALLKTAEEVSPKTEDVVDETTVEQHIVKDTLNEQQLSRFAEGRRFRALVLSLSHVAKIEVDLSEKLMTTGDGVLLTYLLRSLGVTWATARNVILSRKGSMASKDQLERLVDTFNRTPPDVARKVFDVRSRR